MTAQHNAKVPTRLYREAEEAADVVSRQLDGNAKQLRELGESLRREPPPLLITCARGSSDHAATYARYLAEKMTGCPCLSATPSTSSVYGADLDVEGALCLAISQSGRSPDIVATASAARRNGARVIAMVNNIDSPLAAVADHVLDLNAGDEQSVAATKSFIATASAALQLLAEWTLSSTLGNALSTLPWLLRNAWRLNWQPAVNALTGVRGLYVVGRGAGLGMAAEAALKFKEVCGIHAEAFSAAEVLHGPITIAGPGFPVLILAQDDASRTGLAELAAELAGRGIPVLAAGLPIEQGIELPALQAHAALQPILHIQSFYRMVNDLALALGRDPDQPPFLNKITTTL